MNTKNQCVEYSREYTVHLYNAVSILYLHNTVSDWVPAAADSEKKTRIQGVDLAIAPKGTSEGGGVVQQKRDQVGGVNSGADRPCGPEALAFAG